MHSGDFQARLDRESIGNMSKNQDTRSRKLSVLLHADVADSTRLVRRDEVAAHEGIQAVFRDLAAKVSDYGGVAHEIRGDALIAEFSRASDSVSAALSFQTDAASTRDTRSDADLPRVRIGICIGEVVIADGTITGSGVILAQRLEQFAEPGGIVVNSSIAETVPDRFPFEFAHLGEFSLKGFDQLVQLYRVCGREGQSVPAPESEPVGGFPVRQNADSGSLDLSESRPAIAVLPFDNMSENKEQEYFCDGISEDLITELARISALFVIARHSTFVYKNQTHDVRRIGAALGARYLVEGSVRRSTNRVRITAQLINAENGAHLWAERYDREIEDVFLVQDDVVHNIVEALSEKLQLKISSLAESKPIKSIEAYDWLLKGRRNVFRAQGRKESLSALNRSLELDPDLADAHAWLAVYHYSDWAFYHDRVTTDTMNQALASASKAVELAPDRALTHMSLGIVRLYFGEREAAMASLKQALALNPNDADVLVFIQEAYTFDGEPEKGIESVRLAMRHNPHYPEWYLWHLGFAYYAAGLYQEAVNTLRQLVDIKEPRRILAAALAMVGETLEARQIGKDYMKSFPDFSSRAWAKTQPFRYQAQLDRFLEGYRLAGLPD